MLQTRFKPWGNLPLIISLLLIILLYVFMIVLSSNLPIYGYVLITGAFILTASLIIIELKNKTVLITVENDVVRSAKFMGWGAKTTIPMSDITGYKTCIVPREWESTEVLFLVSGNKKLIRLSEYYHLNYDELRHFFSTRFKNLGQERYRIFSY